MISHASSRRLFVAGVGFSRFVVALGAAADLRFHSRLLHNLGGGADDAAHHQSGGNGRDHLAASLQFLGVGLQLFEPVHQERNCKKKNDKKKSGNDDDDNRHHAEASTISIPRLHHTGLQLPLPHALRDDDHIDVAVGLEGPAAGGSLKTRGTGHGHGIGAEIGFEPRPLAALESTPIDGLRLREGRDLIVEDEAAPVVIAEQRLVDDECDGVKVAGDRLLDGRQAVAEGEVWRLLLPKDSAVEDPVEGVGTGFGVLEAVVQSLGVGDRCACLGGVDGVEEGCFQLVCAGTVSGGDSTVADGDTALLDVGVHLHHGPLDLGALPALGNVALQARPDVAGRRRSLGELVEAAHLVLALAILCPGAVGEDGTARRGLQRSVGDPFAQCLSLQLSCRILGQNRDWPAGEKHQKDHVADGATAD